MGARPGPGLGRAAVGAATLGASWAEARQDGLPTWEQQAFDAVNGLPTVGMAVWPVMQAGSLAAVPVAAVLTDRLTGDRRLAAGVGVAGLGAYLAAKVVKRQVRRERPAHFRPDARLRERASGLGFVSGHAAEAVAMGTVLRPALPRRWRWAPDAVAAAVGFGRIFVGAHLPHDVVGGAGLGAMIGGVVSAVVHAPHDGGSSRRRSG